MLKPLFVAVSLDVEEEGLFCDRYTCKNPPVTNTRNLPLLRPLLEQGVTPTLFCAHSILTDKASLRILDDLRKNYKIEIGCHLHHWNTPPLADQSEVLTRAPAQDVPLNLLAEKLTTLFQAAKDYLGVPATSFRMGRWDLRQNHWPLLADAGVLCDASIRPLHMGKNKGPNHFDAPSNPYWVQCGHKKILEIPYTVTPISKILPKLVKNRGEASFKNWGCLTMLPIEHPLSLLKITTLLHTARGGKVLCLTWHSSEMLPQGAPHMPTEATVNKFLRKISAFLQWLNKSFNVTYATMDELRLKLGPDAPVAAGAGDWLMSGAAHAR